MWFEVVLKTVKSVEKHYETSETLAAGLEPATFGLGNRCSIQLSYASLVGAVYVPAITSVHFPCDSLGECFREGARGCGRSW